VSAEDFGEVIVCANRFCINRKRCRLLSECAISHDMRARELDRAIEEAVSCSVRTFTTGATRDTDENKPDYEGFLSPLVIQRFGEYMHKNRRQNDGSLRDSDNWQKGIPFTAYAKSGWRHFFAWWKGHRAWVPDEHDNPVHLEEDLCALLFNVQGYLHELLKHRDYR
jgi:hypothetical protein